MRNDSASRIDPVLARAILAEQIRRGIKAEPTKKTPNEKNFPYIQALFPQQNALVNDESRTKAALCGRRGGKTWTAASYLMREAERWDYCDVAYITLTRRNAKRLLWRRLEWLNSTYRIGANPNLTDLTMETRNGSMINLFGAEREDDIEKMRGFAFKLAIIDESASFGPHLETLVSDVLEPTLLDGDGTILLMGSPNASCIGKLHDVSTGIEKGWSVHSWTVMDNPFLPHAKEWIENKILKPRDWTWDHPTIQREWLGKWVRSFDSIVYRYSDQKNLLREEIPKDLQYILSIDLGFSPDQTVFAVVGFTSDAPFCYVVDGEGATGMLPHTIAAKIEELSRRYEFVRIVCDSGALGKMIVEEIRTRYQKPVHAAEKKDKNDFIEHLNSDFESGFVKIHPKLKEAISQLKVLQWDDKRRKEDGRYKNDWCDAILYGWRESKHWTYSPKEVKPNQDTEEFMDDYWKEEERKITERDEFVDGYDPSGIFGGDDF